VRLHFCGTRGSTPAPGADFVRYGGHTSCVAVARDEDAVPTLILDAGTGLREVTALLAGRPFAGTILLSHLHWDHLHGLPFFRSGDTGGARVTLLLPEQEDGACADAVLERGMSPPHFPIRPRDLRGAWKFGTLAPGRYAAGGFTVEAREVPHKGGRTFGYRISDGRSVLAYIPDHCPTSLGPGPDGWGEYHAAAVELAEDADVLVHDASLLPEELAAEASFGHAAADYAVGLAAAAGARRAVLFHHRPDRTDDELDELGRRLARAPVPVTVATGKGTLRL
jgi:phosphoribosyl 1,2-cyclic phosphodiesterase